MISGIKQESKTRCLYIREHGTQLAGKREAHVLTGPGTTAVPSAYAVLGLCTGRARFQGSNGASLAGHSHLQSWRQRETDSGSSLSPWVLAYPYSPTIQLPSLPAFLPCSLQAPTSETMTMAFHRCQTGS